MDDIQKIQFMLDSMADIQREAKGRIDSMYPGDRQMGYWIGQHDAIAHLARDWNRISNL